jgi:phospholipid transport system substrate-binding protein
MQTSALRFSWILCVFALTVQAAPTVESPRDLIIKVSGQLVGSLQENKEAVKQDIQVAYRLTEESVLPYLDFDRISRWVLGKNWRTATPEQRVAFTAAFRQFLMATYVTAMVTYTDEIISHARNVSYPPIRYTPGDEEATVRSAIRLTSGQTVEVNYQMHMDDNGWRIYDVMIAGVSLAITYRNSFNTDIAQIGIDGLIKRLQEHNARKRLPAIDSTAKAAIAP